MKPWRWPSSGSDETISTSLAERGERPLPAGFGFLQHLAEGGDIPQRVELRPAGERRRNEVPLRDCSAQMPESRVELTDIAQQPALLKNAPRVVANVVAAELGRAIEHLFGPPIEPGGQIFNPRLEQRNAACLPHFEQLAPCLVTTSRQSQSDDPNA